MKGVFDLKQHSLLCINNNNKQLLSVIKYFDA